MRVVMRIASVPMSPEPKIYIPAIAEIVAIRVADETLDLYALCDANTLMVEKTLMVIQSGMTYDREDDKVVQYIGSAFDEFGEDHHVFMIVGEKRSALPAHQRI